MYLRTSRVAYAAAFLLFAISTSVAQPDVIVGSITGPSNYSADGTYDAFSLGTTSCNVGNSPLTWIASNNQHPVIGGNLYKYDPSNNGRFTMIGMSWLKHGFTALQGTVCGPCTAHPNGSALGVGCSDPYGSSLNGSQSPLGPRWQVNASSGFFPYPPANPSWGGSTDRRLKVPLARIDTSATYVSEAQYIQFEDAMADVDNNNCSYRLSQISGTPSNYSLSFTGPTVREDPAINAWAVLDPGVVLQTVEVPGTGGGQFTLGVKRIDNGDGTYRFECLVHNMNVHDSAGSFTMNFASGVTITNTGFAAPEWHSNSTVNNNPWAAATASNGVTFSVDQTFAQNPNSNALRWSTSFNFWFDSTDPVPTGSSLGLYRTAGSASFPTPPFPTEDWETNSPDAHLDVDGNTANDPFVGPIQLGLASGTTHSATLDGIAGQPYQLYLQFNPGIPAYYTSADGEIVNLSLADPTFTQFFPTNPIMPSGGATIPFTAVGTWFLAGQLWCADPSNLDGFNLSACTELSVMPLPRVVVECVGSNTYTADPSGFWHVIHNGTTSANITSVKLSFAGAGGAAAGDYFDTDQGMPSGSGQFNLGQTYELNSQVATGLDFSVSSPHSASGWIGTNGVSGSTTSFYTVEFQFTGGLFNGNTLAFNADTDPSTQSASGTAGLIVTVTLSDSSVLTGVLAVDPSNGNRSFVELQ